MREKILVSWSTGKDSALVVQKLLEEDLYEPILLSCLTEDYRRVSMHGVRQELLDEQVRRLGLPLERVWIPAVCSNEEYGVRMARVLGKYLAQGVTKVAFGDIHLTEVRAYREENLARVNMQGLFPLWGIAASALANSFVELGFQAITTCIDSRTLDRAFVGRLYDADFLDALSAQTDPCGENGEFHTFVFGGPLFEKSVQFTPGEIVLRDKYFYFCDLIPQK